MFDYDTWLARCDALILKKFGLSLHDMSYYPWSLDYDNGLSVADSVSNFVGKMELRK